MRNRFKELDLVDRVPEELWTEVQNIVQEVGTKIIPKKKKYMKAKQMSEQALKLAKKWIEGKDKGERERYTKLNAEAQRRARRDKKAFFSSLFFFSLIYINWRLITLQYCSGFCHTLIWISHGFTCVSRPERPSHLPPHPIPLGYPSAPTLSTCLLHQTCAGDLFHNW